jgi:hypothetical protein
MPMDSTIADLFEKIKSKNLFWSYSKEISLEEIDTALLVETVLKYGDVDDIKLLFNHYNEADLKEIWIQRLVPDERFKKLNFYLARIFFNTDLDRLKLERKGYDRAAKLRMLAAGNAAGTDKLIEFFRGKPHEIVNDDQHQLDLIFQGVKLSFFNAKVNVSLPG